MPVVWIHCGIIVRISWPMQDANMSAGESFRTKLQNFERLSNKNVKNPSKVHRFFPHDPSSASKPSRWTKRVSKPSEEDKENKVKKWQSLPALEQDLEAAPASVEMEPNNNATNPEEDKSEDPKAQKLHWTVRFSRKIQNIRERLESKCAAERSAATHWSRKPRGQIWTKESLRSGQDAVIRELSKSCSALPSEAHSYTAFEKVDSGALEKISAQDDSALGHTSPLEGWLLSLHCPEYQLADQNHCIKPTYTCIEVYFQTWMLEMLFSWLCILAVLTIWIEDLKSQVHPPVWSWFLWLTLGYCLQSFKTPIWNSKWLTELVKNCIHVMSGLNSFQILLYEFYFCDMMRWSLRKWHGYIVKWFFSDLFGGPCKWFMYLRTASVIHVSFDIIIDSFFVLCL